MWCESSQWIFGSSYLSEASSGLWFRHVQFLATVLFFRGFFFSANRSNRAFSKLGGGVFLWYLFICVTHCVGAKVHEVMTLQNAKHGHLLLNSWSVSISQQPPAPCQRGGSPALSSKHRQKCRMQALVLGLLSIILCC